MIVDAKLAETWSPAQISGHLKANKQLTVSHEAIYQRIYADKRAGGTLHRALRCQKIRRKRHTGRERRGVIPNQVSIDQRPPIVAERGRFGDWEADLVIGAGHQQALVTLNERTSRYALIAHIPAKTARNVSDVLVSLLTPFKRCVHTLTTDNGKEFAQHEWIAARLDAVQKRIQNFFFAHPYASWERGANENMNGFFVLCLLGELVAAVMHGLGWEVVAGGFYEISLIGVGVALIRFFGLLVFRVAIPALHIETETPRILEDITVIVGRGVLGSDLMSADRQMVLSSARVAHVDAERCAA